MFERNENGNTLHNHLLNDGFFNDNEHSLSIIDDYHTKDITPEAIDFFREGFQGTGLNTIRIYYQIKEIWPSTQAQINNLSAQTGIDQNELTSFLVFLLTSINSNREPLDYKLHHQYCSGKANRIIQSSLLFIQTMHQAGINVCYQPYNSLNFQPPFHGRYWINQNKGYIVDGSLDTYTHGRIFAQEMDDENFNIILGLVNTEIAQRSRPYHPLTGQRIAEIHNILLRFYNGRR